MPTTLDIQCFYWHLNSQLLKVKYWYVLNLEILKYVWTCVGTFPNYIYFQSLGVVCRDSETQLQMTEKY